LKTGEKKGEEGGRSFAVARFAFKAQRGTDLDLTPGDVVRVLNRCPQGSGGGKWWEGEQQGKKGHFPANHVAELTQEVERVRIRYLYNASRPDEMSVRAGQEVTVLLKRANGWWFGCCGEQWGFFPSNYREGGQAKAPVAGGSTSAGRAATAAAAAFVPKKAAQAPRKQQSFSQAPQPVQQQHSVPTPVVSSEGQREVRARAMFDFDPQNSGDLGFKKGDTVVVLQQKGNWWKGTVGGRTGVFPFNFVELLP
jgi:hypothetical protein